MGARRYSEAIEVPCICDGHGPGGISGYGGVGRRSFASQNAWRAIVGGLAFTLAVVRSLGADIEPSLLTRYVDAIYIAEGGAKTKHPYGIKPIKASGIDDAKRICTNTVRNNYRRWVAAGSPGDFTVFLGRKYCPPSVDPIGHTNWVKNITKLVAK